jgi:multicomponent Na+:H+ antiporter subunit B
MSVFLKTLTKFILKIILLLSVLLVLRGHNFPGGGFIGALVATSGIALYTLAYGLKTTSFDHWVPWVIAIGLLCLLNSVVAPLLLHKASLSGLWMTFTFWGSSIKIGTPLIFDFGIYFLIIGSLSWLIAQLGSSQE